MDGIPEVWRLSGCDIMAVGVWFLLLKVVEVKGGVRDRR
jgi:hypothetical protein